MTDTLKPDEVRFEILDGIECATLHADAFRAAMNERDALAREAIGMKAAWMEARREVEYLKRLLSSESVTMNNWQVRYREWVAAGMPDDRQD